MATYGALPIVQVYLSKTCIYYTVGVKVNIASS